MARYVSRGLLSVCLPDLSGPGRCLDDFGYLAGLKREAQQKATRLGHDLARFRTRRWTVEAADAFCRRCNLAVTVDADPHLGVAVIHGPAVVRPCHKESK